MNWRLISKVLGVLLFIQAGLLLLCAGVSRLYSESAAPFLWATLLVVALGAILLTASRGGGRNMGRKDGYIVVSLTWVVFTLTGMMPLLLSGSVADVAGALFETMSGFTSTGATVIDRVDALPHGILFWRSLMQWIGGVGIIFFTIALLPAFGVGEVKLFAAESTGLLHERIHPRISVTARWIGGVYTGLTVLCAAAYLLCGMGGFDAANYALSTTATGGFSTHSALLDEVYGSPLLEYVMTLFMALSGINYTLLYFCLIKGRFRQFVRDAECRTYLLLLGVGVGVSALTLALFRIDWTQTAPLACLAQAEEAFRHALFTIVSLQTTTGLASCDYTLWPHVLMPLLLFMMFAGACSGSSSGGFKCIRWCIVYRVVKNQFQRILHPRAVLPLRVGQNVLPQATVNATFAFAALFCAAVFGGAFVLSLSGVQSGGADYAFTYSDAFSVALSSVSNVGPGMGWFGPTQSWALLTPASKVVCAVLMLIGRLEIFPILLVFTRSFWKKS